MKDIESYIHIGQLVVNIENALKFYNDMGFLTIQEKDIDYKRQIFIAFVRSGDIVIELIEPVNESSKFYSLLKKRGPGPYHIYLPNLDENYKKAHKLVLIDSKKSAPCMNNVEVCFYYSQNIGIIETK